MGTIIAQIQLRLLQTGKLHTRQEVKEFFQTTYFLVPELLTESIKGMGKEGIDSFVANLAEGFQACVEAQRIIEEVYASMMLADLIRLFKRLFPLRRYNQ